MINYIFGFHRGGGQKEKASIQEQEIGVGSCPIFDADGPLWSRKLDAFEIRRAAAELRNELQQVPDISATQLIGGQRRTMLVEPDPARMAAYGVSALRIQNVMEMENRETHAGILTQRNEAFSVHLDGFFKNADDLGNLVVGIQDSLPVYLRNVAGITDGPEEPADYVFSSPGPAAKIKGIETAESQALASLPSAGGSGKSIGND